MNEFQLKKLLSSEELLKERIEQYLKENILRKQEVDRNELKGHILKAKHNLEFVNSVSKTEFSDWILVGCYYAVYHMALALILKKGFSSKNHDATLSVLIKEYYCDSLEEEEIELINSIYLSQEDILFYVQSKQEREKASYSIKTRFSNVDEIILKTRLFVGRAEEIIES